MDNIDPDNLPKISVVSDMWLGIKFPDIYMYPVSTPGKCLTEPQPWVVPPNCCVLITKIVIKCMKNVTEKF